MTCYCTLFISSHEHSHLPSGIFLPSVLKNFDFTDQEWPERRASRLRLEAAGIRMRPNLPRYSWNLDTNGTVSGTDIHDHIRALLEKLRKGKRLSDLTAHGYTYFFSIFWGGNGTGGGPLVTDAVVTMLAEHKAEMAIGFYYEEAAQ